MYGQYKVIPKAGARGAERPGCGDAHRRAGRGDDPDALVPQAVTIFLTAESEEELIERLCRRKTRIRRSWSGASRRRAGAMLHDGLRHRIVNRECSLDETVEKVIVIIEAEKARIDWEPGGTP